MKRFWQQASVTGEPGAYAIALDGKPMRLPAGPTFSITGRKLAEAIAAEWSAAGSPGAPFDLSQVPLTRLAATAQHYVTPDRAEAAASLAAYGDNDVLCYRATQPEALAVRQHKAWQPWLDWAAATYGARLEIRHGVMPAPQPRQALARLHHRLAIQDAHALTALLVLVPAYGSLVLGLAVAAGQLPALDALRMSQLDELFQEEQWGEDSAATARRAHIARDVAEAGRYLALTAA